mmetsp:Transcript_18422/g.25950  ORF Transcript_18422/g.25950 Transcript_18422/m.25950 type:complete len:115 (-) Transcript_18422:392-736(-)
MMVGMGDNFKAIDKKGAMEAQNSKENRCVESASGRLFVIRGNISRRATVRKSMTDFESVKDEDCKLREESSLILVDKESRSLLIQLLPMSPPLSDSRTPMPVTISASSAKELRY